MSSYLVFRYVIRNDKEFFPNTKHQIYELIPENQRILVNDEFDIDKELKKQFDTVRNKRMGILLSGGMDSACLASYMKGSDAYTFRFMGGNYQREELLRAEYYAKQFALTLHYVDIDWSTFQTNLIPVMKHKGAPVHSIEPQIMAAANQAKRDGIELMIIGDAADYVFGGMDRLHAKDWLFDEFVERYTYVKPESVLAAPVDMTDAFEKYRIGKAIDFISFMHEYTDIESYASYKNAFDTAEMPFLDPYEVLKMAAPLDLQQIRNGNSKYLIRALFRMKYLDYPVPQKNPMPRPVDAFFRNWTGPNRREFRKDLDLSQFTGNQKWLLYCLECFLNLFDPFATE